MEEMSAADQRKGLLGTRVWRWSKDLNAEPRDHGVESSSVVGIVDVDYYMDMPDYLSTVAVPTLLYTVSPEAVAGTTENTVFHFNDQSEMEMHVTGGAHYKHKIWDYGTDSLTTSFDGLTVVYLVDRKRVAEHRYLVLLTPLRIFADSMAFMADLWLDHHRLARLDPVRGRHVVLKTVANRQAGISFGLTGTDLHVELPSSTFTALEVVARNSGTPITLATVESFIPSGTREKATALLEYLREKKSVSAPVVYPLSESIVRYQFGNYEPEAKSLLTPFMSPLVHGCFVPDNTTGNEKQCMESRVLNPKTASTAYPSARSTQFAAEFIERAVPKKCRHKLRPISHEEVVDRCQRPGQILIALEASNNGDHAYEKTVLFKKKEPYAKIADPRGIVDFSGGLKTEHGRYIYPAADHCKELPFYSFGHTPREQAERVASICQSSESVNQSDGHRWDMHVSPVFRHFEQGLMTALFHPDFHDEMIGQMEKQHHRKLAGRLGNKCDTEWGRLSGSMETGLFNTMDNAYMAYCALRLQGHSADSAWDHLCKKGSYGGDDAITGDLPADVSMAAAKMVGQVLEVDVVPRGKIGVNFLARHYGPDVWYGDSNSASSVLRQMSKFHTTAHLPSNVTPKEKCWQKCMSYYCSDRETPVLGVFVEKFLALAREEGLYFGEDKHRLRHYYKAAKLLSDQYPNDRADWMLRQIEAEMPGFDVDFAERLILSCKTTDEMLNLPCLYEVPVKPHPDKDVTVVNGQAPGLLPTPTPTVAAKQATPAGQKHVSKSEGNGAKTQTIPPGPPTPGGGQRANQKPAGQNPSNPQKPKVPEARKKPAGTTPKSVPTADVKSATAKPKET